MDKGYWEYDEKGNAHYHAPETESEQDSWDNSEWNTTENTQYTQYTNNANQTRYTYRKYTQTTKSSKNGQSGNANANANTNAPKKAADSKGWRWFVIILAFMFWWPLGLILLLLELSGGWPERLRSLMDRLKGNNNGERAANMNETYKKPETARPAATQSAAGQKKSSGNNQNYKMNEKEEAKRHGLGHIGAFKVWGWVLTVLFGLVAISDISDGIAYSSSISEVFRYILTETMPLLALTAFGIALIVIGSQRKRKLGLFRKYRDIIGDKKELRVSELAGKMGRPLRKAVKDLEEMIRRGYFEFGYVDEGRGMLVLDPDAGWEAPAEEAPSAVSATDEDETERILREIREVNDAIPNPELTRQIDRIGELTAKILRQQKENPEKASELRSFMNYYLPKTLEILNQYARLDAQGVEGENIAEAKTRIEGMMEKLVEGYERQLDRLFADDVVDISADISVMEQMLAKDGLTAEELHL